MLKQPVPIIHCSLKNSCLQAASAFSVRRSPGDLSPGGLSVIMETLWAGLQTPFRQGRTQQSLPDRHQLQSSVHACSGFLLSLTIGNIHFGSDGQFSELSMVFQDASVSLDVAMNS
ncbi:MAG: hypothetical protein B6245_09795 [Desulfobacteraceae bacterium 4572_88]|nr:MAG: hypothetical protein B6245_09795 [Desulfobacteraceae bacterium 4572_88]